MIRLPREWSTSSLRPSRTIRFEGLDVRALTVTESTAGSGAERFDMEPDTLSVVLWDSPPLSEAEEFDIERALEEFASPEVEIFETPEELIRDLHRARERYRREDE